MYPILSDTQKRSSDGGAGVKSPSAAPTPFKNRMVPSGNKKKSVPTIAKDAVKPCTVSRHHHSSESRCSISRGSAIASSSQGGQARALAYRRRGPVGHGG